jgi:hypothetical protein
LSFSAPALAHVSFIYYAATSAFLPGFGHPLIAVLPQEAGSTLLVSAFNREVRMFILTGFINYLAQLLRHMEANKAIFSTAWVSGYALLLYSPRSCPLRAF